jgi:hypothetical protein
LVQKGILVHDIETTLSNGNLSWHTGAYAPAIGK